MNRVFPVAFVMLVALGAVIALSNFTLMAGLIPDDAVMLWASAIAAGDREMPIGRIVAAYPTIPFLATALLEFIVPLRTQTTMLLTSGVLASLAGIWLVSFRRVGIPTAASVAATLLLVLHPGLLRAALTGPAEMIMAAFLGLLGGALHDLRARSSAPEVMAVALALLGLSFSHPMGAALTCAAVPLVVFAIRPEMLASPVINLVIAIIFPTTFCVAAFAYMSWVFPGSGWSFLIAPAEGLATWAVGFSQLFGHGLTGSLGLDAAIAVAGALVLAAPLVPVGIAWVRRQGPLVTPVLVIAAMAIAATWITVTTGLFGDPAAIAVMPPILAATMIVRVPKLRERLGIVFALLVVGWIGGIVALKIVDPRGATNLLIALEGRGVDRERIAAIDLGSATIGREGVLADTFNAPAIVLGRGRARGLLSPSDEAFALGVLFSRIDAPFVAVPDPQIGIGSLDRLNKAFPTLYRHGTAGYRLIYENANWRLFARN